MCQYCELRQRHQDLFTHMVCATNRHTNRQMKKQRRKKCKQSKMMITASTEKNTQQHTMRSQPNGVTACRLLLLLSSTLFFDFAIYSEYFISCSFTCSSLSVFVCLSLYVCLPASRSLKTIYTATFFSECQQVQFSASTKTQEE